ncbi:hypothetical protein [Streptomyces longhuiensis]|uniref:hypothetical protein n=1 Tax=Streptomyces longhuiensis TaxID=2880933 RepID=UPI001D0A3AB7|nr:hypothetical protein [Streptomyces longhuiensis]UDM05480.1 hypothetical protein LGI35_45325 [Streptomyces longhuiensis]
MEPEHEAAPEPVGRIHAARLAEDLRVATGEARQAAMVLVALVRDAHRALTDAERHQADTKAVRYLIEEMVAAGGRLGQIALELAPAHLSDREAAGTVLAQYAHDIGCDMETVLATRRYALTGNRSALEGTWIRTL